MSKVEHYKVVRVSILLLYDERGRILLQHRTADAPLNPNRWGFFGGHIEEGETPMQALMRESYEELRYHPINPVLYASMDFISHELKAKGTRNFFLDAYREGTKLELHEGQGMAWFTFEETARLEMLSQHREQLEGLFSEIQRLLRS